MRLGKLASSIAALAACAMFLPLAQAQDSNSGQPPMPPNNLVAVWNYSGLYANGLSAQTLLGADVHDRSQNEAIGEIEDLVVSKGGVVTGMIIDLGGILSFSETFILFPFDKAQIKGTEDVWIDIRADKIHDLTMFPEVGGRFFYGPKWRITNLIDDYAIVGNRLGYGWVEDVVINKSGQILAVVVQPDVTYDYGGEYAWPFYGYRYGFEPAAPYYAIPYTAGQVANLEPFDYGQLADPSTESAGGSGY